MHLPVGTSNFRKLIEYKDPDGKGYLFVDKSLLIKEIIYDLTEVIVLARPRRFGKTLNLSMLHHFFTAKVDGQLTGELFKDLQISKETICMQHQGQSPVIFINLKDAKYKNFDLCYEHIKDQIIDLYTEYNFLAESDLLTDGEKDLFKKFLARKVESIYVDKSIKLLTTFIKKVTGKAVIILIDEYDTPIQEAYLNGYYDQLISFMRNLFGSSLKDNPSLKRAILTGILRISKESLFSGLNNVKVYSILNPKYSNYFGFTDSEVNELLIRSKLPANLEKTKEWYNGYNFGGTTVYNPLSIIEFINEQGRLKSYWVNTSANELVKNLIINSPVNIKKSIETLIAGSTIKQYVDEHIVFNDLNTSSSAIWCLLLMSGYLKYTSYQDEDRGCLCELKLPNQEVENFYVSVVQEWITADRGFNWYIEFINDLAEGKVIEFEEKLQTLVEETLSFHDVTKKSQESFYHGLMLAFISGLKQTHMISSNKESGSGRYDVAIIPKDSNKLGIIMEFKAVSNDQKLIDAANAALLQIKQSKYSQELSLRGINKICAMGIGFSGKSIKIVTD